MAVMEARLDAVSTAQWHLFRDPALAPILEYAYFGSEPRPQVESRPAWETLGLEMRCVLESGCETIGTRGAVLNVAS